nr:uncharacterized protein LOC111991717 [Quercus suber]
MTTLAWNCRGLGIPQSVQALKDLVRAEDPMLVFVMETKASISQMKKHKNKINQHLQALIVPSDGKSGGLALLWKENADVRVQSYSHSHIDAIVHDSSVNITWRATGFYGHPDAAQRSSSWRLLETLNAQFDLPWVVFGDFNEITHIEEKCGGAERNANQMEAFRNALDNCDLRDLGFVGQRFTWCNGRFGDQRTLVRLDRMVANNRWTALFQQAKVCHRSMSSSDHCLLALYLAPQLRRRRGKAQFRFESMWARDVGCRDVVEMAWSVDSTVGDCYSTQDRIRNCQHQLQWWGKNVFGNLKKQINEKQTSLQCLENRNTLHEDAVNIQSLRREINELLERESAMWKQRSKSFWYQSGDRNTRFFHTIASQRQQKNRITGLEDNNGVWQGDEENIQSIILNYFSSIYQTDQPSQFNPVTEAVERKVTHEMNNFLLQTFHPDEVRNALFQMHPTKSQARTAFLIYFFPLTAKHWFSASCNDWGFSQLLSRKDLEDASKGFLVEDTLIVEAEIMVMSTVK